MADTLGPGTVLSGGVRGDYVIDDVLGRGGFGITYSGHDAQGIAVAIKEFFPRDKVSRDDSSDLIIIDNIDNLDIVNRLRARFMTEGANISKIRHDSIVTIFEMFEANGTAYMVMELIDGIDLKKYIKTNGTMSHRQAVDIVGEIAGALGHLHANRITHLDVKPENIILDFEGHPKLIDFGLSHQYNSQGGSNTQLIAAVSPGYTAIEQYNPKPIFEPRSDIYSLGATLYYLITGHTPPEPTQLLDSPELIKLDKSVPANIRTAINQAMQFKRENRIPDMRTMIDVLAGKPYNAPKPSVHKKENRTPASSEKANNRQAKPRRRAWKLNLMLILIIMCLIALVAGISSGSISYVEGPMYISGFYGLASGVGVFDIFALARRSRILKGFAVLISMAAIIFTMTHIPV